MLSFGLQRPRYKTLARFPAVATASGTVRVSPSTFVLLKGGFILSLESYC
jgi:hypothetical protein